ncbi:transposase [Rhizobium leguminosarum]|uniref:transposase n=1 Tax=Rhizobium leguminosarum TaxID=384 RepID=UPI003F9EAE28
MAEKEIQTSGAGQTATPLATETPQKRVRGSASVTAATQSVRRTTDAAVSSRGRKYSSEERQEKLRLIEAELQGGKARLKDAVKSAGITEQTYYVWKRARGSSKPPIAMDAQDHSLEELLSLEKENTRLRLLLAQKLRHENLELRKKLGL